MQDTLTQLDATAQAELVRKGDATPLDLVDAAIARIEAVNAKINAVITPLFEKARAQAKSSDLPDGPFRGVPFLLKDLICQSEGDPFHSGMRFLRDLGWKSDHDTYLAAKLRAAGFIFLGKTNVPELGPLPTTEPEAYGPTRNPWSLSHSPGGSSGGSGAAVAAGLVAAAHGNDGGGSIRIPSSACGLVGLKPSLGRNSLGPDNGELWNGCVVEHVLTRSVRDTAAILDVVAGPMVGDPYFLPLPARPFREEVQADPGRLRIGLMTGAPASIVPVDPDCVAAVEDAARLLESLGHTVETTHPAALDEPEFIAWFGKIVSTGTARDLDYWSNQTQRKISAADVEAYTWSLAEMGRAVSGPEYMETVDRLQSYTRRLAGWWASGFDLLLTPTLAVPPPPLGHLVAAPDDPLQGLRRSTPIATFTAPFNATGQPAISLPLHWNGAGLPIGVQLVAAYAREDVLIRIAAQLEKARPWSGRRPSI
jgi:amidase